jgi:hypothetical protein
MGEGYARKHDDCSKHCSASQLQETSGDECVHKRQSSFGDLEKPPLTPPSRNIFGFPEVAAREA